MGFGAWVYKPIHGFPNLSRPNLYMAVYKNGVSRIHVRMKV